MQTVGLAYFLVYAVCTCVQAWKTQYYWQRLGKFAAEKHPELLGELGLKRGSLNPFPHCVAVFKVVIKGARFEDPEMALLLAKCRRSGRNALLIFLIGGCLLLFPFALFAVIGDLQN
jgi:hypothetical protein